MQPALLTVLYLTMYSTMGMPPSSCLTSPSRYTLPTPLWPCTAGGLGSPVGGGVGRGGDRGEGRQKTNGFISWKRVQAEVREGEDGRGVKPCLRMGRVWKVSVWLNSPWPLPLTAATRTSYVVLGSRLVSNTVTREGTRKCQED